MRYSEEEKNERVKKEDRGGEVIGRGYKGNTV
jgi:hypothetical protein